LVVLDKATLERYKALENYIIKKKVSHIHTVPAYLKRAGDQRYAQREKGIIAGGMFVRLIWPKDGGLSVLFIMSTALLKLPLLR